MSWLIKRLVRVLGVVAVGMPATIAAQESAPILVLEVPVELRTLSPEVASAYVECLLVGQVGLLPPSQRANPPIDTLGTARSRLKLVADATGGRASESVRVTFTVADMIGEPRRPGRYECGVVLAQAKGSEWPAVLGEEVFAQEAYDPGRPGLSANRDTAQARAAAPDSATADGAPVAPADPEHAPPDWSRMQWGQPDPGAGAAIKIGRVLNDVGEDIYQAWMRAEERVRAPGSDGNHQGDRV